MIQLSKSFKTFLIGKNQQTFWISEQEKEREITPPPALLAIQITYDWISLFQIQAEVRIEKNTKPSHGIVEIATQEKAKFIVTGCRGMGLVRRTILGSVSDFILHHAHCPVFIYKKEKE